MSAVAYIGDPNLFGWYLGWIIGGQAQQADQGLGVAHDNTYALRDLTRTGDIARSVTRDLHRTRRALER